MVTCEPRGLRRWLTGDARDNIGGTRPMTPHTRPYRLDDAEAVLEAVQESMVELQPWMPWCHAGYSLADARTWVETHAPPARPSAAFEFAIVSGDRYLGGCGLNQIDAMHRRANLGYWVRSTETGRGVATAAVRAVRDWAFTHTDLVRLEIVVAAGNDASHRVAIKAGADLEGVQRHRLVLHGAAVDATMFSLTRDVPDRPMTPA